MPRWVIDLDPDSGRVEVHGVGVELHVVVERTGRFFEGRHEVRVRQVAGPGRDFTDGCAGAAVAEVLGLDPITFGEVGWADQQRASGPRGEP